MSRYVRMPRYAECACGRKNSIKLARKREVPAELDSVGYSRCPECQTQSIHFAGPAEVVRRFAAEFQEKLGQQGLELLSTSDQAL